MNNVATEGDGVTPTKVFFQQQKYPKKGTFIEKYPQKIFISGII